MSHITQKHNHRMVEVRRDLWGSCDLTLHSGTRSLRRRLHHLSEQPVPRLSSTQHRSACWCAEGTSRVCVFVSTTICPDTGHHWQGPDSIFFTLSLQVFMDMDEIPLNLLFSRWSSSNSQLSQPLLKGDVPQALKHLDGSTLDLFQKANVPLALRSPVLDQDCRCSLINTE